MYVYHFSEIPKVHKEQLLYGLKFNKAKVRQLESRFQQSLHGVLESTYYQMATNVILNISAVKRGSMSLEYEVL